MLGENSSEQGAWGRLAFSIGWFKEDLAEEETFEQTLEGGEEVSMQLCRKACQRGDRWQRPGGRSMFHVLD